MTEYTHCLHCGDLLSDRNWCRNCGPIDELPEFQDNLVAVVNGLLDWIEQRESHHMPVNDYTAVHRAYRAVSREPKEGSPLDFNK